MALSINTWPWSVLLIKLKFIVGTVTVLMFYHFSIQLEQWLKNGWYWLCDQSPVFNVIIKSSIIEKTAVFGSEKWKRFWIIRNVVWWNDRNMLYTIKFCLWQWLTIIIFDMNKGREIQRLNTQRQMFIQWINTKIKPKLELYFLSLDILLWIITKS